AHHRCHHDRGPPDGWRARGRGGCHGRGEGAPSGGRPAPGARPPLGHRAADPGPGIVVLEGGGASLPPVAWAAGVLVVPATCPVEYVRGYLGPYRLLRADLAVVT